MKNTARKLVSALLAVGMLTSVLTACNKPAPTGTKTTATAEGFNATGLPIMKSPYTLKVLTTRWGSMGDSFKQNQWLKDLEKNTNIKVEWQVQSMNDWAEQKSIMLAGGKVPEVIIGNQTFNDSDIINNQSLFLDLTDLIDKYMPNLKAAMKETPKLKDVVTFADGKIYSLPKNLPCRPKVCNQPIINKKWLDNLGLKVPTTVDELYTVLKAFKEKDANGNGDPNDELPISGSKDVQMDMLNPFGITDLNATHMMVGADNSLSFYPTSENYKEGIKWFNKLYKEGIIDPQTFTQDPTMQDGKRKNKDASLVGFDYAWTPDSIFGQWSDEYIAIAPIKGPDGKQYAGGDADGISSILRNEAEITTTCKNPEIAARWLDQFYDGEASIQNFWGAIGTVISKNADGTYTLNDPPKGTSADAWYWDQSLRDFGPKYISPDFEKKIKLSTKSGDGLKQELSKLGNDFITKPYPNVIYTAEENEQRSTLQAEIETYITTTRAKWITKGGIDAEWDSYVNKLKEMGLDNLLKIYKDAYDRHQKVANSK